ncbi:hypothetical protein FOL47_008151, partial [Perkinsus chesapeaki]
MASAADLNGTYIREASVTVMWTNETLQAAGQRIALQKASSEEPHDEKQRCMWQFHLRCHVLAFLKKMQWRELHWCSAPRLMYVSPPGSPPAGQEGHPSSNWTDCGYRIPFVENMKRRLSRGSCGVLTENFSAILFSWPKAECPMIRELADISHQWWATTGVLKLLGHHKRRTYSQLEQLAIVFRLVPFTVTVHSHCDTDSATVGPRQLKSQSSALSNNLVVFLGYVQLALNIAVGVFWLYMLYSLANTISADINEKMSIYSDEVMDQISQCSRDYRENKCDPSTRVPAVEQACRMWEQCMARDPVLVAKRSNFTMETLGESLNGFFEKLTWKTIACL